MKLLGIDYGNKRIGIALGDTFDGAIVPYGLIENKSDNFVIGEIKKICDDEEIDKIIIGIPYHKDMESEQEKLTEKFVEFLKNNISTEVEAIDEAFTSKIAQQKEEYKDLYKDRKKGWKDAVAAAEILRDYIKIKK